MWLDLVKDNMKNQCDFLLIGNKIDLIDQREVLVEEGIKFASKN